MEETYTPKIEAKSPAVCAGLTSDLKAAKVIGTGKHGRVVLFRNDSVLKIINLGSISVVNAIGIGLTVQSIENEVACLMALKGSGITADFLGAWSCERSYYLQMSLINNAMPLSTFIRRSPKAFDMATLQRVVDTVVEMNLQWKVINEDLHLDNILMQTDGIGVRPFIIDFGRAILRPHVISPTDLYALWFYLSKLVLNVNVGALVKIQIPVRERDNVFVSAYRKYPGYELRPLVEILQERDRRNVRERNIQLLNNVGAASLGFGLGYGVTKIVSSQRKPKKSQKSSKTRKGRP